MNYVVVSLLFGATANPRVEIPYRPTFIAQLRDGNVATITAKGLGIEGTFGKAVTFADVAGMSRSCACIPAPSRSPRTSIRAEPALAAAT